MNSDIERKVAYWLSDVFDDETKNQVRLLQRHPQALRDAFFCDLSFGTGGMRGLMGPGTNRMNVYTVRQATQGLANYLKKEQGPQALSVVIGFDSRHHSSEFAKEAARVLAGNGIRAYLLTELRPTPYVSFACRQKKANAAIVITASHNPKEYNGYKVYWSDGAQVVAPHDEGIVKEVSKLRELSSVKLADEDHALIEHTSVDVLDKEYLLAIAPQQLFKQEAALFGNSLHIVYTSLHGTGATLIPKALQTWGFSSLHFVKEQMIPDGNFPTTPSPNPEDAQALERGIDLLRSLKADVLFASDPDADRLGVVVRHQGQSVILTGNEIAALCADYLCKTLSDQGKLTPKSALVTTIVTTELLKKIADAYKIHCVEVLTGFKYIGQQIHLWEKSRNGNTFLLGAEESYGYLVGTHARDKDAIVISCVIAEMTLHAKLQGYTLVDSLHRIYKTYGMYKEKQASLHFGPGQEGMNSMKAVMAQLRNPPPLDIGGKSVLYVEDYETRTRLVLKEKRIEPLSLPRSDVLLFRLEDHSRLVIRPSGTEPKLKLYGSVHTEKFETIEKGISLCDETLSSLLQEAERQVSCLY